VVLEAKTVAQWLNMVVYMLADLAQAGAAAVLRVAQVQFVSYGVLVDTSLMY
jgi:hypothetical protein